MLYNAFYRQRIRSLSSMFDHQMKHSPLVFSLVTILSLSACKHEHEEGWRVANQTVIHDFDSSRPTVKDLVKIIDASTEEGFIRVIFPTGQWNWNSTSSRLPTKEKRATIEFRADDISERSIRDWIEKNQIKGVFIQIDYNQPAEKFFILEKILRDLRIIYWVGRGVNIDPDKIVLQETDGKEPRL